MSLLLLFNTFYNHKSKHQCMGLAAVVHGSLGDVQAGVYEQAGASGRLCPTYREFVCWSGDALMHGDVT